MDNTLYAVFEGKSSIASNAKLQGVKISRRYSQFCIVDMYVCHTPQPTTPWSRTLGIDDTHVYLLLHLYVLPMLLAYYSLVFNWQLLSLVVTVIVCL